MKRHLVMKLIITAFVWAVLMTISCEKNMTGTEAPQTGETIHLGKFGVEIDDATGVFRLFIDGKEVDPGNGLGKINVNINDEVTLGDIDYTPLGCDDYPATKVRTLTVTFNKKNNGTTLSDIYASISTPIFNIDGAHAVIDVGDNEITGGESFTLSVSVILSSCSTFSVHYDLEGTVN